VREVFYNANAKAKFQPTLEPSKTRQKTLMQVVGTSPSMCESRINRKYNARFAKVLQAGDKEFDKVAESPHVSNGTLNAEH
jgi:hypothetical protein